MITPFSPLKHSPKGVIEPLSPYLEKFFHHCPMIYGTVWREPYIEEMRSYERNAVQTTWKDRDPGL